MDAVANGENSAPEGRGITADSGTALPLVVHFLTLGDHAFRAEGSGEFLDRWPRVIRLANLDGGGIGRGCSILETGDVRVGATSVQGRLFMREDLRSPFEAVDRAVADPEACGADLVWWTCCAEATSKKQAKPTIWRAEHRPSYEGQKPHASALRFRVLLTDGTREVRFE